MHAGIKMHPIRSLYAILIPRCFSPTYNTVMTEYITIIMLHTMVDLNMTNHFSTTEQNETKQIHVESIERGNTTLEYSLCAFTRPFGFNNYDRIICVIRGKLTVHISLVLQGL